MGNIWVKGLLLWEKEKNEVLSAELGGNRESGAEDSKLDGETGLSGSSKRELAKLPERTILFLEENQDTLFPDVIEKPFLLVSKMFWDVSKMYEVPVRGKEMVLLDGANGFAEIYYMPVYPRYHCLSEETVFNNDYSVIQELILDKEKIKYVPPVFEVAEVEKDYLICRLDFIESILRRGAKGIKLAELKVE